MAKRSKRPKRRARKASGWPRDASRRCGLCGKSGNVVRTECCGNWICDDEDEYVLFSFARNSCHRNHRRYTLCGYHHQEGHEGHWQDCAQCRKDFESELELYVHHGTNEYNFETLRNPPEYEPTRCAKCNAIIVLSEGGYTMSPKEGYLCGKCSPVPPPPFLGGTT